MGQERMTVDEWNEIRVLVDEYVQKLDDEKRMVRPESSKTEDEKLIEELARRVYERSVMIEPAITNDIRELTRSTNGSLLGRYDYQEGVIIPSHVLKEKASIKRKIVGDSAAYHGSFEEAANHLRDTVRYTIIFDDDSYIQGVDSFLHQLEDLGYYDIEVKNNWGSETCQGINAKLKTSDGIYFEIQFHTPYGHHIKEECTRTLYRVIRDDDASGKLKFKANKLRKILQASVKMPVNAKDYQFQSGMKRR